MTLANLCLPTTTTSARTAQRFFPKYIKIRKKLGLFYSRRYVGRVNKYLVTIFQNLNLVQFLNQRCMNYTRFTAIFLPRRLPRCRKWHKSIWSHTKNNKCRIY